MIEIRIALNFNKHRFILGCNYLTVRAMLDEEFESQRAYQGHTSIARVLLRLFSFPNPRNLKNSKILSEKVLTTNLLIWTLTVGNCY